MAPGMLLQPHPSIHKYAPPSSSSSSLKRLLVRPHTQWPVGLRTPPPPHLLSGRHLPLLLLLRRRTEKKGRSRGNGIYASLFGVGAPEALVIGVVALLVFGPKGLAEVARNLGKTLRAFQPTIRELQDVSREFKSTLEREIGLDEVPPSTNNSQQSAVDPNGKPQSKSYTSDELSKLTAEQMAASAAAAWETQPPPSSDPQEAASSSQRKSTALSGENDVSVGNPESNPSKTQPSEKAETEN